jgi:uncharacterized protein YndB with AHSA1/START domain
MPKAMIHEVTYPHPPERVWRALTDREALAEWLMDNDFQPRLGAKFQFKAEPMPGWDGTVQCEVLELQPPKRMVWSWKGGAKNPMTRVEWTLTPTKGGTRLRLEHSGLTGLKGFLMYVFMNNGWGTRMLRGSLPELLDQLAKAEPAAPRSR